MPRWAGASRGPPPRRQRHHAARSVELRRREGRLSADAPRGVEPRSATDGVRERGAGWRGDSGRASSHSTARRLGGTSSLADHTPAARRRRPRRRRCRRRRRRARTTTRAPASGQARRRGGAVVAMWLDATRPPFRTTRIAVRHGGGCLPVGNLGATCPRSRGAVSDGRAERARRRYQTDPAARSACRPVLPRRRCGTWRRPRGAVPPRCRCRRR